MAILEKNAQVGRFVVQNLIKHNQYTETYRAVDQDNNPYFLKLFVLNRINPKLVNGESKWVKEIEYCKLLKHRNVISFIDCGTLEHSEGACQYYVTNYLSGRILSDYVAQRGPLPEDEAVAIYRGVLQGLNFMHNLSPVLCHNDIDPSNIMLTEATGGEPQIVDLGHLSQRCSGRVEFDTSDIDIIYHAKENMVGIFDEQSDIFSATAVLYFMLTGKAPWIVELNREQTYREQFMELSSFRKKNPVDINALEVSGRVKAVLREGMALKTEDRAKSVAELLAILDGSDAETGDAPKSVADGGSEGSRSSSSSRGSHDGFGDGNGKSDPNDPNKFTLDVRRGGGNGFADIAGMQELKEFLYQKVIFVIRNEDIAKEYQLTPPNGMLLYGPPGCGKTFFAEKFAEETEFNFALIKSSDLASSFVHGSQEKIGKLFKQAEKHRPIVLCFDEFDALVPDRSAPGSSYVSSEVNEFLTQMNNCAKRGIFVVATTNRPDKIDPAIRRTGRIDRMVYVPLPDYEARKEMFRLYVNTRPVDDNIDYDELAKMTEGYIASDIAYIVNDAAMTAAFSRTKISQELMSTTIKNVPPSLHGDSIAIYDEIRRMMEYSNRENVVSRPTIGYAKFLEGEKK